MYYVYELVDPRTGKAFYVGKGKNARLDVHGWEARSGVVSGKCDTIRSIEADGLKILKRKARLFSDEQEAYDFEAELICEYGLENLTNIIPGGGTARNGPTTFKDRIDIAGIAEGINRTKNGGIKGIYVNGQYLGFSPIIEAWHKRAGEIIDRRGAEWANKIAERFGVEFCNG